jgi:hypothetical protein
MGKQPDDIGKAAFYNQSLNLVLMVVGYFNN